MWTQIAAEISKATGQPFEVETRRSVSGGCINQGYMISGQGLTYFIKLNQESKLEMFAAESLGLKQMEKTKTIRVPKPITLGTVDNFSYLVLEYLELGRGGGQQSWATMGQQLAALHQAPGLTQFGWEQNNTIGSTPQINSWTDNWADFFAEYRIGYQVQLANRHGGNFPSPSQVIDAVRARLAGYEPQPSLVHGDLWSGNAAITQDGEPVILDPATYVGDREVDLAMTELFGGFPTAFYQGYNQEWPLDGGYSQRKTLYNLYHILNHFNLFGGGYGSQASQMLREIMAD